MRYRREKDGTEIMVVVEQFESDSLASPAPASEASEAAPASSTHPVAPAKKRRGFAAMDPKKVSEIASKGGRAAHAAGTAHEFSTDEARAAGRKGGFAAHAKRKQKPEGS